MNKGFFMSKTIAFHFQLVSFLFLFSACSTTKELKKNITLHEAPKLTEEQAQTRFKMLQDIRYDLIFDLSKNITSYSAQAKINFNLTDNRQSLRVDFHAGNIISLKINNVTIQPNYNSHFILIDTTDLKLGANTVEIHFSKDFSNDGVGFYRFEDKEDKRVYTYTNLEPYGANKVFPCFDQPNLKAKYTMTVLAPKDWQVVTSTLPTEIKQQNENKKWTFPQSALFSTYIWSLHAGPYAVFTDKNAKYPSRIFIRQSLKKYIKINDWFTFTRQSFEFLNDYFGYEYPYQKYDQLIVPDFNSGAMENVAAVTFNEGYISRGEKTIAMRRSLANVIFHEMAHMWFGNLVTMNWWNDLWLNESFATYMANLGLSRNTEFKDSAWPNFNGTKNWAYWEDQLVTTHPIEAIVPDTEQAFANFDGITYGKGASSLKQIHFKLGEEGFKRGLQFYFKKHANTNTKLIDFMQALEEGSNTNLLTWQKSWLQTTGVNTIKVNYSCHKKTITNFSVSQSPSESIREHSFKIALLKPKNKVLEVYKTLKVDLNKKNKNLSELIGVPCPELVYPNYEDHGYLRVALDDRTLHNLPKNIDRISDNFLRQLFFISLWDMVYYGEYNYKDYIKIVFNSLPQEKNFIILNHMLNSISGRYSNAVSILFYLHFDETLSDTKKLNTIEKFENLTWNLLQKANPRSERQKILYDGYIKTVASTKAQNVLINILTGKIRLKGLKIDQDKRWQIIIKLMSYGHSKAEDFLAHEKLKDKSSLGIKMAIATDAVRNTWASKQKWIKEYKKEKSPYSYAELSMALYNLFPRNQSALRMKYGNQFFKDLTWVNDNKDTHIASTFTAITPRVCSDKYKNEIRNLLDSRKLNPGVEKKLKINLQENERCRAVINKPML